MAHTITDIQFKDLGPHNPAQTDRITGQVWLNERLISKFPTSFWEFIISHEKHHIIGNNRSEFIADEGASKEFFAKYPHKPMRSVDALTQVLPMNTPEQHMRVAVQKIRAAQFDCAHNGKNCNLVNFTGGNTSNFLTGDCKPGQYACIAAETKRKQAEAATEQQQLAADSLQYQADLNYKTTIASLLALSQSDQSKIDLAKLNASIELKKLDASQKAPIDTKKLLTVALVFGAALVVAFLLMGSNETNA